VNENRDIELVVNKFSSYEEAEEFDEALWSKASFNERLEEWIRIFNMYCKFQGMTNGARIEKVVTKTSHHAL